MSLLLKSSRSLTRDIRGLTKCVTICAFNNKTPLHENQIKSYSFKTPFNTNNKLHIFNKPKINVRKCFCLNFSSTLCYTDHFN